MFTGRPKIIYFEHIVEKVRKAIEGWKARTLSFGGWVNLVKSVLLSYPIYTLASSMVPQTIIRRINSLMSQFLWNIHGEARTNWISWESVCTPVEAGGLEIGNIDSIWEALHAKLIWLILSGSSLWARYARSRFFRNNSVIESATDSPLWCLIANHYPRMLSLTKWLVGKGKIGFWTENLAGEILGGPLPYDARLTVAQGLLYRYELLELIPQQHQAAIREVRVDHTKEDRLICTFTNSGKFSAKELCKIWAAPIIKSSWAK